MKTKIFKIFLSTIFMLSITTIGSTKIFANNENYTIVKNEYLELKSNYLLLDNLSKSRINILTDYDKTNLNELKNAIDKYPSFIYNMKELSINQLKNRNYNNSQINAIKNYDGSEEMTVRASAYVTGTYSITDYKYNSSENRTYATGNATATWNGTPFFQLVDQLAIALSAGVGNFIHYSSSCTSTYKVYDTGQTFTQIPEKEIPSTSYIIFKLPRERYSSSLGAVGGLIKVSGKYTAIVPNLVNVISMRPCYAHKQIASGDISISLSKNGLDLSFSISTGYVKEWYPNAKTATL